MTIRRKVIPLQLARRAGRRRHVQMYDHPFAPRTIATILVRNTPRIVTITPSPLECGGHYKLKQTESVLAAEFETPLKRS